MRSDRSLLPPPPSLPLACAAVLQLSAVIVIFSHCQLVEASGSDTMNATNLTSAAPIRVLIDHQPYYVSILEMPVGPWNFTVDNSTGNFSVGALEAALLSGSHWYGSLSPFPALGVVLTQIFGTPNLVNWNSSSSNSSSNGSLPTTNTTAGSGSEAAANNASSAHYGPFFLERVAQQLPEGQVVLDFSGVDAQGNWSTFSLALDLVSSIITWWAVGELI